MVGQVRPPRSQKQVGLVTVHALQIKPVQDGVPRAFTLAACQLTIKQDLKTRGANQPQKRATIVYAE